MYKNGVLQEKYGYDSLNQLARHDSVTQNKTIVYAYDLGGNITSVTEYAYTEGTPGTALSTRTYTYGDTAWKDLLTGWNGQTFTYDEIGNPLTYRDGMSFTWSNGRSLTEVKNSANETIAEYSYNASGIRTSKTVGSETRTMYLDGTTVKYEAFSDGRRFTYMYDAYGELYAVRLATYSNPTASAIYYYIYNLQGDVIALVNSANGQIVARYEYDAWGKITAVTDANGNAIADQSHIAHVNPFRYRGYYYDNETGLYYLNSRYYDPEVGRFINADGYASTGQEFSGCNMFTYCGNNPIIRNDLTGKFWKEIGNFFKDVGTTIVKTAKKVAKAVVGSFQIEVGVGVGLGASAKAGPAKLQASAYQDSITIGLKNGSTYTSIKGSAGISGEITKNFSLGFSTEYEHRFETDLETDHDEHTTMSMPWDVYNCPKTVKDPIQFSVPLIKNVDSNLSQGLFVGFSGEAHVILGGHFTIGWDVGEFIRLLTEEE